MPGLLQAQQVTTPATPVCARIKLMSFGFKYGLPPANYYFDVSFTTNPARDPRWGLDSVADREMVDFVLSQPAVEGFIERAVPLLEHLCSLDGYQVVGFGCNSGRHRSPIIANEIASRLMGRFPVTVVHRDLPEHELIAYELCHAKPGR